MYDLLTVEQVDVRRITDPDGSRICTLTKVQFPAIKFKTYEHMAAGGFMSTEYMLPMIEALQPAMSTKGLDPGTMKAVGFVPGVGDGWVFAAAVRDVANNKILALRATIVGIVTEYTPGEHTPGSDPFDIDHAFKEVTSYELTIDGEVWFKVARKPPMLISYGTNVGGRFTTALGL